MYSIVASNSNDVYRNLASEELMLLGGARAPGSVSLFLWQNADTVVIGRNQNAWREVNVPAAKELGVSVARRITGGGAVFHDLRNLNFSFITDDVGYDLPRQMSVIIRAVGAFGIQAQLSGRNDIVTADGRKFSGNAFFFKGGKSLHHGTLLLGTDFEKMSRCLVASAEQLSAKGVKSVRARVTNLSELSPDINVKTLSGALSDAFEKEYGSAARFEAGEATDPEALEKLRTRNASWEWNFGKTPEFDASFSRRFPWGGVELLLTLKDGVIERCRVFSDALDVCLPDDIGAALAGCAFRPESMAARMRLMGRPEGAELSGWMESLGV